MSSRDMWDQMKKEEPEALEPITFLATFPDIQSAIKIGADGVRIQLDIPEKEQDKFMPMVKWKRMVLKVTVEPEEPRIFGAIRY